MSDSTKDHRRVNASAHCFFSRNSVFDLHRDLAPDDRAILTLFFGVLIALRYVWPLMLAAPDGAEATPGVAHFLGFAALALVLNGIRREEVLKRGDFVAITLAALALIHPWQGAGALALTGLGFWFITRRDRSLISLGQLCLGFACLDLWGAIALRLVSPWLLPVETLLAFILAWPFGDFTLVGNSILGQNDHGITVYEACSVFGSLVSTAFMWLSLVKIQGQGFQLWHFRVLALALATIVLINTVRLALMAQSFVLYVSLHVGAGGAALSIAIPVATFGLFLIALRDQRRAHVL